jgi:hypothetical protein
MIRKTIEAMIQKRSLLLLPSLYLYVQGLHQKLCFIRGARKDGNPYEAFDKQYQRKAKI